MSFDAPDPPDYGEASREAIEAEIANLPRRYDTELKYRPKFAELDADAAALSATKMAEAMLEIEQEYGPEFTAEALKRLEESDPGHLEVRSALIEIAKEKLESPGKLSGEVLRETQQSVRRAQASRGNILGDGNAFIEAQNVGDAAYRREQTDIATAAAILQGQTPQAQFSQISGAQSGAAPFVPMGSGPVINPNAGAQGAQFASRNYGTEMQGYVNNPWMEVLGVATGVASGKLFG